MGGGESRIGRDQAAAIEKSSAVADRIKDIIYLGIPVPIGWRGVHRAPPFRTAFQPTGPQLSVRRKRVIVLKLSSTGRTDGKVCGGFSELVKSTDRAKVHVSPTLRFPAVAARNGRYRKSFGYRAATAGSGGFLDCLLYLRRQRGCRDLGYIQEFWRGFGDCG